MKKKYHNILGKEVKLSVQEALWYLGSGISEAVLSSECPAPADNNMFGRPVSFSGSGDLAFASGIASTGLRAVAFLNEKELAANTEQLEQAVRQHIPLVVFAASRSHHQLYQLSRSGALLLLAHDAQETVDLMLIAHKIAEQSLIPVIIGSDANNINIEQKILIPDDQVINDFLGNTDDNITSPTVSQQIIFGKNRRRIPNWFNMDNPVMLGVSKGVKGLALETAAQQQYFYEHLDDIVNKSFNEFAKLTGRQYKTVEHYHADNAEYIIISTGEIAPIVKGAVDQVKKASKAKVGSVNLKQLSPFPVSVLQTLCANKKAIMVLEQSTDHITHAALYKELCAIAEIKQSHVISGHYGTLPSVGSVLAAINNILLKDDEKQHFWLDVAFTKESTKYPKHQVLLETINREYPAAKEKSITSARNAAGSADNNLMIPLSVRQYKDKGPAYSRLSRFYDDTACFYDTDFDEVVADPFQAVPLMPPATANFADLSTKRKSLPVFDPGSCTGCGACFVHCPHSAIPPLAINLENLIKTGVGIAVSKGATITQLTPPVMKNLAKASQKVVKEKHENITTVADWLPDAFDILAGQMNLDGDKLQEAKEDINIVIEAIGKLSVAVTDVFFNKPDSVEKGSGELFTLAVDPLACSGCAVCVDVCDDEALTMQKQTPDIIRFYQDDFKLWEQLPDSSGDTIARLIDDKNYDSIAAILLSRNFYMTMTGGNNDDTGTPEKSMLHIVTAIAESAIQPKVMETVNSIDDMIKGLSENIHTLLSQALPSQDFEALSKALAGSGGEKKPFEQVIEKLSAEKHLQLLDTKKIKRKIDLTESLKDLKWLITEGPTGTGRTRMGLVLNSAPSWSGNYPWNNFSTPVLVHMGSSPELAKGVIQGHIRHILDNIKLLRRAELEIKNEYEPEIHDARIASITWKDLNDKEKALVPMILIIGKRQHLTGKNFDSLIAMLDTSWPLKAVVLDDAISDGDNTGAHIIQGVGALLPAIALQNAYVLKSSMATPEHLFSGLQEAMQSDKPALLWLFAPDHKQHTIASDTWAKLNALALNSRAFSVLKFNPQREGMLLSSKIDIRTNPANDEDWKASELTYMDGGEEKTISYTMTWADWAYTLKAWEAHFNTYTEAMGASISVSEYLALDAASREGKIPIILRLNAEGELKKYVVSDTVVAATGSCNKAWQVLREVNGDIDKFPEELRKKVEAEVASRYEEEKTALKKEYEDKIKNLEQAHLQKIRANLRDKLVALSQHSNVK